MAPTALVRRRRAPGAGKCSPVSCVSIPACKGLAWPGAVHGLRAPAPLGCLEPLRLWPGAVLPAPGLLSSPRTEGWNTEPCGPQPPTPTICQTFELGAVSCIKMQAKGWLKAAVPAGPSCPSSGAGLAFPVPSALLSNGEPRGWLGLGHLCVQRPAPKAPPLPCQSRLTTRE